LVNYVAQLHPFYQNVAPALDIESLFEVTEGVAHVVAAQPMERLYEVMGSFCHPIAAEIVALQRKGDSADEKDHRKVAGGTSNFKF
jgi:transportin-3